MSDSSRDPLDYPATSARLRVAFDAAGTPAEARAQAVALVDGTPGLAAWSRFLQYALLLLGAGLVLAGVISFFAFNWASLGRFGKFALLDVAIAAGAMAGWRYLDRLAGKVTLAGAAVLVGPLLVVYGQTYQTGADPWGLFAGWAVLIAPWVVAARFTPLWAIEVLLVDVALVLVWVQVAEVPYASTLLIFVLVAVVHAMSALVWEWQRGRAQPWLEEAWAPRLLVATGFVALMVPSSMRIVDSSEAGGAGLVALAALAGALAAVFWYYQRVRSDVFMLTAACGTLVVLLTLVLGRLLIAELDLEVWGLLLMALIVIGEVAAAVAWLRHVVKERAA